MQTRYMLLLAVAYLRTVAANNLIVSAGGDLQAALNAARPGDTVTIAAGATYVGHYRLAPNPGPQWITIQSSAMSSLPPTGSRVSMTQAAAMPKLVTPDQGPALFVGAGANYYHIRGIEVAPAPGLYGEDLIQVGAANETSNSQLAHDVDFDRDYIHGDPITGSKRGLALNGGATTIENCYFSSLISTGQDTQAIAGWNGPGPYTIINNYLEAGTEIVAFGGAPVSIPLNIPSDILIKNNTFFKPLSWRQGDPSYAGIPVWAKNHIELKDAQRVTIDSNTFTNNWVGGDQQGFVMVFGVRLEGGLVPWAVVKDVTVTNNVIRHAAAGALFMGADGFGGSAGNFLVQNNLWEDLRGDWGGDGRLFQVQNRILGVNFDHNTAFETAWLLILDGDYNFNINMTNNIFNVGWGIIGPGSGVGAPSFSAHSIGGVFLNNVLIGGSDYPYPATTQFVPSINQVDFVNYQAENFLLASNSPFKGMATDGTDLGAHLQTSTPTTPSIPTGWVNIISKNTGKCLDVAGISLSLGAPLHQWTCWGGANQAFKLTPVNGGYTITPEHSGLTVEVEGGPGIIWPGAPVDQWSYWGGSSQIWQIVSTADGYLNFKPANDGLCMDVSGSSKDEGAPVVQSNCANIDSQKWSFKALQ
jgi:hypothetical protein